jgi:hypothetical protein
MARYLKHEGCSHCGSRDNVGVYDDGSKFCFGCHWYSTPSFSDKVDRLGRWHAEGCLNLLERVLKLPNDFTLELPRSAYEWITQYLNHVELMEHEVGWSDEYERLIFPVKDENNKLLMWTGRKFSNNPTHTKYLTQGLKNEVVHIIPGTMITDQVVFTEDIVSAIKVARVASAIPLFGTKFPLENAHKVAKRFKKVVFWLDPNMKKEAIKQAMKLEPWFESVRVIFSDFDPKDYTQDEIEDLIPC